jgi:hypothetical protein
MPSIAKDNVSYRLLNKLSKLVICSRCLRQGKVTPVPQLISVRHTLTNECADCRSRNFALRDNRHKSAKLLRLHG